MKAWGMAPLAVMAAVLGGACGASTGSETDAAGRLVLVPPAGLGLQAVLRPDFSAMGASVAGQLREPFAALEALVDDGDATAAELAGAYGEMGSLLLAARELETAEIYFLNAQSLAPSDWRWSQLLGHVYRNHGPLSKAVTSYEHALDLRPDALATLLRLGDAYLALGRAQEAAPLFARALALDAGSAAAWFGAGRAALALEDDAEAVRALEEALARDPGASAIHYPLAMAHRRLGNLEQAQAHLARQGDIEPWSNDPLLTALDDLLESALDALLPRRARRFAFDAGQLGGRRRPTSSKALALSTPRTPSLRHRLAPGPAAHGRPAGRGGSTATNRTGDHPEFGAAQVTLGELLVSKTAGAKRHWHCMAAASGARSGRCDRPASPTRASLGRSGQAPRKRWTSTPASPTSIPRAPTRRSARR